MQDNELIPVSIQVRQQGAPVVNTDSAYIHAGSIASGCVAIYVDLHSKRCTVESYSSDIDDVPGVCIGADEHSLKLDESRARDEWTEAFFPELKGWDVFAASVGRYTLSVCLTKRG